VIDFNSTKLQFATQKKEQSGEQQKRRIGIEMEKKRVGSFFACKTIGLVGKLKSQIHNYGASFRVRSGRLRRFRIGHEWLSQSRTIGGSEKGIFVLCKSSIVSRLDYRFFFPCSPQAESCESSPEICGVCGARAEEK
jgi:hypothetical protein